MDEKEDKTLELANSLANYKEELFLAMTDLEKCRIQKIALKDFIQNLYESYEGQWITLSSQLMRWSAILN